MIAQEKSLHGVGVRGQRQTQGSEGSEQARFSGCLSLDPRFHSAQPIFSCAQNPNCRSKYLLQFSGFKV